MANNRKLTSRGELRALRPSASPPFKPYYPVPVRAVRFIDDPPPLQKPEFPGYLLLTQADIFLTAQDGSNLATNSL